MLLDGLNEFVNRDSRSQEDRLIAQFFGQSEEAHYSGHMDAISQ